MAGESSHDLGEAFKYKVLEQISRWSSKWTSTKAENMKIWEGYEKIKEELEELKDHYEDEDVADVTTMEDELEIDQVGPGSYSLQTLMDEDWVPHDEVSTTYICVSLELLVNGHM